MRQGASGHLGHLRPPLQDDVGRLLVRGRGLSRGRGRGLSRGRGALDHGDSRPGAGQQRGQGPQQRQQRGLAIRYYLVGRNTSTNRLCRGYTRYPINYDSGLLYFKKKGLIGVRVKLFLLRKTLILLYDVSRLRVPPHLCQAAVCRGGG